MKRYAVVPTTGRAVLQECLDAIVPQVDAVVVIAHNCVPEYRARQKPVWIVSYAENPPNISEMWNIGLEEARNLNRKTPGPYHVAVLNDDAVVPPDWFATVSDSMVATGATAGSVDQFGMVPSPMLFTTPEPINLYLRMSGFAFILDTEPGLWLDQQFQWYYGDDDLDWSARLKGGTVRVPGTPVDHRHPDESTNASAVLTKIAGEDRERFITKWGKAPH